MKKNKTIFIAVDSEINEPLFSAISEDIILCKLNEYNGPNASIIETIIYSKFSQLDSNKFKKITYKESLNNEQFFKDFYIFKIELFNN